MGKGLAEQAQGPALDTSPDTHTKKPGTVACARNPSSGEVEIGRFLGLDEQTSLSGSVTSGLHTHVCAGMDMQMY